MRTIALAVLLCSTAAHAETKAWAAAKKVLPTGSHVVGGMNVAVARGSTLYQQMLPMLLSQAGSAKDQLDAIRKACGIDMLEAIDSIAVGFDDNQHGAIVIAIKGTTRKDLETCAEKRATGGGQKFSTRTDTKADGGLTLYQGVDGKDVWVKWLATDVVALTTSPEDKVATTKLLAGGALTDKLLKGRVGKTNTSAMVWGVATMTEKLDAIGATMSAGYGSINATASNLAVTMHLVVDNAKAATDAEKKLNEMAADAKTSKQLPDDITKSLSITSANDEVAITTTFPEKVVFELIGSMMGGMSH
jgi:hypothetical protein